MRFTKIKFDGKDVELRWTTKKGRTEIQHDLTSTELPAPEFAAALKSFVQIVLNLILVNPEWGHGLRVQSLSINTEKDGRAGIVVTCLKKLTQANAPLVVNTPHLREPVEDREFGETGFFTDGMAEALLEAENQAEAYVGGKRAQGELFNSTPSESPELVGASA